MNRLQLPKDFYFGASLSSHQAEGGNVNNWSEWEVKNAVRLANQARDKKGWVQGWDDIKEQATSPNNYISGQASDHFNKYAEDFKLARELNLNSLRFSIEWSRIEPKEGAFDQEAIEYYRKYIAEIKANGLEPFLTVWHWTVPVWFEDLGAFKKKSNLQYFERFVELLAKEYSNQVKFWIILNEPRVFVSESYFHGRWPPQENSLISYFKVLRNLMSAHKSSYKTIKKYSPDAQIGIAENIASYTSTGDYLDRIVRKSFAKYEINLLKGFGKHLDFIGLNYYFHRHVDNFNVSKLSTTEKSSDLGWDLYPEGIYSVLTRLRVLNKPIIITENGLADRNDSHREWFIYEVLRGIEKSIAEGIDVKGYLHWSLIDNFEWDSGFWPRFGLIKVDYENNFKRSVRKSAITYAELIKDLTTSI